MHIVSINRAQGLAVTDTGVVCAVTHWFDADGDLTDDREAAVSCVAPLPNGKWAAVDLSEFEPVEVH
ncbi:hypothetical protein [Paracoccus kondratievae]|uniref:Uncharacterized protein n=1 Tax=Paracoccus kondratievae TaxID=135740 RepID=A0AAD3RT69_9RHOB|nr:hypothetical protein [Paracoccus kondratievae]AZV00268.1 hypothetical protein pkon1_p39 [Paracoccus phage vB_PkoS_Pkon1]GLK63481.1 hypothetical protein GCM10017635_09510 [Paracoccus kondratievae]